MVWFNVIVLLIMSPTIKKIFDDYMAQRKAGIEKPVFNPQKLGIKNADLWMEINADKIAKEETMKYILGIDIGTTAIKAAVIGEDGEIYGTKTSEYPLTTLPSGEVEADLSLYEEAFKQSIKESVKNARVPVKDIKCIGFSSTAETCVFWMKIINLYVK